MACKYRCSLCGKRFDKFSGQLVNLSDLALKWFYALDKATILLKCHKHVILCADCLEREHGQLGINDLKTKNGKQMTSNLIFLAKKLNHPEWIPRIVSKDNKGLNSFQIISGEMVE